MEVSKNDSISSPVRMNQMGFVTPSILLFIDQLLVAAGGWIYWIVITGLTTASEIGNATIFYSLAMLVTAITQLGLEYPLLKRSSSSNTGILGMVIMIEMVLAAATIPAVLYVASSFYGGSPQEYGWLAAGIVVLTSLGFVSRFALLGMSDAKSVLLFDLVGTAMKFGLGYFLVSSGYGGLGILLSFLAYNIVVVAGTLAIAGRKFSIRLGSFGQTKEIMRDGLTNMPSKLSKMFVMSLSVVLLAAIGVTSGDIGVFYIILMISLTAGSFAASTAYMVIPASSAAKSDLSLNSMRLGLSFSAPLIAVFIAQPQYILSLIGNNYAAANVTFMILSLAILPSAILNNTIARLNNLNKSKALVIVGSTQIAVFLVAFYALSPSYGSMGASLAILLGLSVSTILSFFWSSPRSYIRYVAVACAAIFAGWLCAYAIDAILPAVHPVAVILASLSAALAVVFGFRIITVAEIRSVVPFGTGKGSRTITTDPRLGQDNTEQRPAEIKYLLLGNYGNHNIGDEMLLRCVIEDLSKDAAITPRFFIPTRNPDFVGVYHKSHSHLIIPVRVGEFSLLLKAFLKSDAIIVGGGGIWSGYTGPMAHLIPLVTIAGKMLGKKVEYRAIGLYSTASALDRLMVNLAIPLADSCSVRDDESYQMLWKKNRTKTERVDDLAIQYLRRLTTAERIDALNRCEVLPREIRGQKTIVGISVKPVNRTEINERITSAFSSALNSLNLQYPGKLHFVFFPFAKTDSAIESDAELTQNIVERLDKAISATVAEHHDPLSWFIAIKENVDLFIGMRFHSIVFASEANKPILCIPYENKVTEFLRCRNNGNISVLPLDDLNASGILDFVADRVKKLELGEAN